MTDGLIHTCAPLDIPVLETERLILRAFRADDASDLLAMHSDEAVMRYLGGKVEDSLREAYDYILRSMGHWSLHGFGKWAVEEKASGRAVGRVGYLDLPHDWPGLELGWTFARASWGRGYATEAALAARDWGFEALKAERVISMIHPDNEPSKAVAAKIGEAPWQPYVFLGTHRMLWSITRSEWDARAMPVT